MYDHLVKIAPDSTLSVYRVYEDGRQELFISIELPADEGKEYDKDKFSKIAKRLGEDILVDSPKSRRVFNLD